MDYEVYDVLDVRGHGAGSALEQEFVPFYARNSRHFTPPPGSFTTLRREPRLVSSRSGGGGTTSSAYSAARCFLSLVDGAQAATVCRRACVSCRIRVRCCRNREPRVTDADRFRPDRFPLDDAAPVDERFAWWPDRAARSRRWRDGAARRGAPSIDLR
jgi:type VI secretion system protein ImpG